MSTNAENRKLRKRIATLLITFAWAVSFSAHAEDASSQGSSAPAAPAAETRGSDNKNGKERNFYEVLDDVLADFEFDLKNGNTVGITNLAIKNIALSENVPPSFKSHLELLITERILKITKTKVIQCLPCRTKKTSLSGDQVVISSPDTNPAELSRIAKSAGIEHFMDMAFTYQPTGIVLSMNVTDPENGSMIWSRNYNSENSRASAFRRGVDYSQLDEARKFTEYQPQVVYRAIFYYLFEPNSGTSTGTLGIGGRMVERYDNRKKEVGFELDYLKDASTLVGNTTASGTVNLYSGIDLTLLFLHTWNLIGSEENYNSVRGAATLGVGGTYASGFLGALVRGQYEWRLGKHYAVSATVGYRPQATAFIGSSASGQVSGVEWGMGINLLF